MDGPSDAEPERAVEREPTMATVLMLLGMLTGTWEAVSGDTVVVEAWGVPRAAMLLGTGQTVRGEETLGFEFLRVVQRDDGLFYVAQPQGGTPTEFGLVDSGDGLLVFENPRHDHPRRITYQVSGDEMKVTLEGSEPAQVLLFRRTR